MRAYAVDHAEGGQGKSVCVGMVSAVEGRSPNQESEKEKTYKVYLVKIKSYLQKTLLRK